MIRIDGEVVNNFRDDLGAAAIPLQELAQQLRDRMARRIHEQGLAGDGAPWGVKADGTPERFRATGELEQSIDVYLNPGGGVTIAYNNEPHRSSRGKAVLTNQQLARILFRDERTSPMRPTADELAWFEAEVVKVLPATILKPAAASALGGTPRRLVGGNRLMKGGV